MAFTVIGPILSFIALMVLAKTFQLQRREWQEARSQARVDRLLDFAKHVYEEFDNLLDHKIRLKIKPEIVEFNQAALAANAPPPPIEYDDLEDSTFRKLLNVDSRAFPDNVVDKESLEKIIRPDGASEWDRHYHIHVGKMIKLIMELNGLLRAINLETGSEDVAAFYVNRCRPVTCATGIVGYIPLVKMSKICPFLTIETYGKQGPIKWIRVGDKFVREDETGF